MIYLPHSVEVGSLFKDTQMKYAFLRWENSQTQYQNSCNEPFRPQRRNATRSGWRLIPTRLDLLHSLKKRKLKGFFEPYFFGARLSLSGSVKYLGVTPDSRLTRREHVGVMKARNLVWACRKASGAGWDWDPGWSAGSTSPSFRRRSPLHP